MQRGELKPVLKELRKVRCGTERPDRVPAPLALYMGHGIGHLCDLLASWLEGDTVDRRGADATIRFYGLGRMPEPISSIAATLRAHDDGRSLSVRQVENLIAAALTRAERRDPIVRVDPSAHQVAKPCDPFPLPLDGAQKRCLAKVLLWAWADVVGPPGPDGSSLMLYEQEHGLRAEARSQEPVQSGNGGVAVLGRCSTSPSIVCPRPYRPTRLWIGHSDHGIWRSSTNYLPMDSMLCSSWALTRGQATFTRHWRSYEQPCEQVVLRHPSCSVSYATP
jgi:hypothetical protein